jgi:hypothetical protein
MTEHVQHRDHEDTDGIDIQVCPAHSGMRVELKNIKEDVVRNDTINNQNHEAQWRAIDKMRNGIEGMTRWIAGAMGLLILAFATWILNNFHVIGGK